MDLRNAVLSLGCLVCSRAEAWVEAVREEDGGYTATLCGHFRLSVPGDNPLRVRLLMLFLRLLEEAGPPRGSRRTRDRRTPLVRQEQLAAWFQLPQPDISRVEKYWREADWPNQFRPHQQVKNNHTVPDPIIPGDILP
jgi:hypothetical protein